MEVQTIEDAKAQAPESADEGDLYMEPYQQPEVLEGRAEHVLSILVRARHGSLVSSLLNVANNLYYWWREGDSDGHKLQELLWATDVVMIRWVEEAFDRLDEMDAWPGVPRLERTSACLRRVCGLLEEIDGSDSNPLQMAANTLIETLAELWDLPALAPAAAQSKEG